MNKLLHIDRPRVVAVASAVVLVAAAMAAQAQTERRSTDNVPPQAYPRNTQTEGTGAKIQPPGTGINTERPPQAYPRANEKAGGGPAGGPKQGVDETLPPQAYPKQDGVPVAGDRKKMSSADKASATQK